MDYIASKIDKIETLLDVLFDDDYKKFMDEYREEFNQIADILTQMENKLCTYEFNDERCKMKQSENKKNSAIMKDLFRYYLLLKENVDENTIQISAS